MSSKSSVGFRWWIFLTIEKIFSTWGTQSGEKKEIMWPNSTFGVLNLLEPSGFSGFPEYHWYSVATSFLVLMNSWASLCHPWEIDAASGLEFWFVLASSLADNPTCRLEALTIPGLLDAIGTVHGWRTYSNRTGQVHHHQPGCSPQSCYLLIVLASFSPSFRWCSKASWDSWRCKESWNGWCWTNKEDYSLRHVWNVLSSTCLPPGVWCQCTGDLKLGSPSSFGPNNEARETLWAPRHMSHCWTAAVDYHFNNGFIVLKHAQHRNGLGKFDVSKAQCTNMNNWWISRFYWVGTLVCNETSFVCSNSMRSCAGIPSIFGPASLDIGFGFHEKLMSVSCTSKLLERTCDFQKCTRLRPTLNLTPSLPSHRKNHNLEITQNLHSLCCVLPHDTIVWVLFCDECKTVKRDESFVTSFGPCWWSIVQVCSLTKNIKSTSSSQIQEISEQFERTLWTILQHILFLLLWIDSRQNME